MQKIEVTVNGTAHEVEAAPETPLVYVLRNALGMKGVRAGCGVGVCGSCAVIVDGEAIRSCSTPLEVVAGRAITTPEGLGDADTVHPVQEAFLAEQAAQCGFCTNGLIMGAVAAQERGDVTEPGTVPVWLDEHVCRCGAHVRILRAIERANDGPVVGGRECGLEAGRLESCQEVLCSPPSAPLPEAAAPSERIESWLRLGADGRFEVHTGKVELGQGIRAALAQLAAGQLGVPIECVDVVSTSTGVSPNEGYTAGSLSVEDSGTAVARASVAFRRALLDRAAELLDYPREGLELTADRVVSHDGPAITCADIAAAGPVVGDIGPADLPDWAAAPIGHMHRRQDLIGKLTGAPSYVHDLTLPGMLHARPLLPPSPDASLDELSTDDTRAMPGVVEVVRDGRLVIVIAEREDVAARAIERLRRNARWRIPDTGVNPSNVFDHMRQFAAVREVASEATSVPANDVPRVGARYSQPYHAHASIAPSCAIGHQHGGGLQIWTHSQGVYPLRDSLAALLELSTDELQVVHADGPGCYGHNLADDAAAFAAIAARAVRGRPVRFQFSSEDEFTWEPYGSAMLVELSAVLGESGKIEYWRHEGLTDTHNTRPDGLADRLVPSWLIDNGEPLTWPGPNVGSGGIRNAVPIYDLNAVDAFADHVNGRHRTSALRTLGSYLNTFAAESFMDELAEAAGRDPLAFRLSHLTDERAAHALRLVAAKTGWEPRVGPSGRGVGLAVARYKDTKAYVAIAVHATVDPSTADVEVQRVDMVCDAGVVVSPDGAMNQLEGGIIQALSRALYESVDYDGKTVLSQGWSTYPVFPFSRTPRIDGELVASSQPPLGVGEASLGPVAAALANAIDDAVGIRLRHLPFTPDRIRQHLFDMSEAEAARVLDT